MQNPALSAKPPSPVQIRAAPPKSLGKSQLSLYPAENSRPVLDPNGPKIAVLRTTERRNWLNPLDVGE
jgi:hypothetical protein